MAKRRKTMLAGLDAQGLWTCATKLTRRYPAIAPPLNGSWRRLEAQSHRLVGRLPEGCEGAS